MTDFIEVPITVDETTLQDDAFAYLQDKVTGYTLNPAHPMTWLIEALSRVGVEATNVVSQMPAAAFRYLGETVYGIPPNDGTQAIGVVTFTSTDTDGHDIPAGTEIVIGDQGFATDELATIPAGSSSVTNVPVTAIIDGTAGNDLGPDAESVDAFAWLDSVAVVGTTSGGSDAESNEDYEDRLAELLTLQSPRPITPEDYAAFAQQYPGVDRAAAIDLYDPYTNLLTANQASLETDTTGWAAGASSSIAQTALGSPPDGTKALAVTRNTTTGNGSATTSNTLINGDQEYTARADFRAATTARSVQVGIVWYDASSVYISEAYGSLVTDSTSGWTSAVATLQAPVNARYAQVIVVATSAVATEVHYVDKIALKLGNTTTWSAGGTDPLTQARMVTVIPIDEDGEPISSVLAAEIQEDLEDKREVNFIVNVIEPTYSVIDVVATVKIYEDFDPDALEEEIEAAILDWLSPANWGTRPYSEERVWENTPVIRRNKLIDAIGNVEGVNYVDTLTIEGAAADYTMAGAAPLPSASSTAAVTATVG